MNLSGIARIRQKYSGQLIFKHLPSTIYQDLLNYWNAEFIELWHLKFELLPPNERYSLFQSMDCCPYTDIDNQSSLLS